MFENIYNYMKTGTEINLNEIIGKKDTETGIPGLVEKREMTNPSLVRI